MAELDGCHPNTVRARIKRREYESYLDGGVRKVTRRSALARRNRLLQEQTTNPTLPPPPDHVKIAKARTEARKRRAALLGSHKQTDSTDATST
jgi:hypothetical protein